MILYTVGLPAINSIVLVVLTQQGPPRCGIGTFLGLFRLAIRHTSKLSSNGQQQQFILNANAWCFLRLLLVLLL